MKKYNVLIISDFYYPHWTGLSKGIYNLTQELSNEINFTVLTVRFNKNLKKHELKNNVQIIREDFLFSLSRVKYSVNLIFRFFKEVKKNDVIFINSPFSNILPISLLSKMFHKKLLVFHQGDLILPKGFMNRILEKIFDFSSFLSFSFADKVSTYTDDYAQQSRVLKPFLDKFTPLILPVYITRTKDFSENKLEETKLLKKKGAILLGFAGRFVEEKGFDILFKAIPLVTEKFPHVHFVFAGETNMKYENFFQKNTETLTSLQDKLTMLGLLNDQQLSEFYNLIDFIVIPSRSDCFNLVQMEAMLHGKPAIVSDIPGARYVVKKSGFGLLFEKENSTDLANKIIDAINNQASFQKNYTNVLNLLDNEQNAKAIRDYIEQ